MAVISIVGTSGVGKSYLVKQVASMTASAAFFEGGEGTIPDDVLKNVFSGENPLPRWSWFLERYLAIFNAARTVSDAGVDAYIDISRLTCHAIAKVEGNAFKKELSTIEHKFDTIVPDKTILLIASHDKIEQMIKSRNRKTENIKDALERAIKIQDALIRLANKDMSVKIIDRTALDFNSEPDLKIVLSKLY